MGVIPLRIIIMVSRIISSVLVTALFSYANGITASPDSSIDRTGKHFSLFSVVTFKNEECTSDTSLAGGARKGTCYTTTECSDKGGTKSGNCASGFGVCCVFISKTGASATIKENRTHLRNSEYPSTATATATTTIVYTISKQQTDICQLRFDFTSMVLAGPINSQEIITIATYNSHCQNDQFKLATTANTGIPIICGTLTGQHLYVDLSPTSTDSATATIVTSKTTANTPTPATALRIWDFQVSQIPCYASYRAPHGCDQYFMEDYGKLTSLNFYKVSGSTLAANGQNSGLELASQHMNTCIRRSKGMCCVQYDVCVVDTQGIALVEEVGTTGVGSGIEGTYNEGFTVTTSLGNGAGFNEDEFADFGGFDAMCSGDYVDIPSSFSGKCGGTAGAQINTRYCGAKFGANLMYGATGEGPPSSSPGVCDCSEPFSLRHGTDMYSDIGGDSGAGIASINLLVHSRGFCIDYLQLPCSAR